MMLNGERVRKVQDLIVQCSLNAEIIWHRDRPVLSMKDAMEVHGIAPGNVLKCLILKDRRGTVVAVMAPGDVRIDVNRLERLADLKKLTFMSREEMIAELGAEPGAVDPLTLPQLVSRVFVEKTLLEKDFVIGSAGSKYCGLKIRPREIIRAVNVTIADLA